MIAPYISGVSRDQIVLFSEAIDDDITEENPVRFIGAILREFSTGMTSPWVFPPDKKTSAKQPFSRPDVYAESTR